MKLKYIFFSLFIITNVLTASADFKDENLGTGSGGGSLVVKSLDLQISNNIDRIIIINEFGIEINHIYAYELEDYSRHLTRGEYTLLYINSNEQVVDQQNILVE